MMSYEGCGDDALVNAGYLPRELQLVIYSYTSDMARRYARYLNFKKFGDEKNETFTDNYYRVLHTLTPMRANRLWSLETKFNKIVLDKQNFFINNGRPCLQHSYNDDSDFRGNVYPDFHELGADIWAVNDYDKLISYCLKVTLSGYYTILFVKLHHMDKFRTLFTERVVDHHMRKHIDKYITYYSSDKKNFEKKLTKHTIPRILCIPHDYNKMLDMGEYLKLLNDNGIKNYILFPKTINAKINGLMSRYSGMYSNGSGNYKF